MFYSALAFGALAGLSIGPVAILILNLAVTRGAKPAVHAALGAALGDLVWGTAAFLGGSTWSAVLVGREVYFRSFCSGILVIIATRMFCASVCRYRAGTMPDACRASRSADRFGALIGTFALTCSNPLTAVVFVGFLSRIDDPISPSDACGLGAMVFVGSLAVQLTLALLGSSIRPLIRSPFRLFAVNAVSQAALVGFALSSFGPVGHLP